MVPERWLVLTVRLAAGADGEDGEGSETAGSDAGGLVAEALIVLGGRSVSESDDGFSTCLPEPSDPATFIEEARERLLALTGLSGLEISWEWQAHEDWAELWKSGLGPRRVTDRIIVAPSWNRPEPADGEIVITIDPGMAFGTAEHATTRGSIRLLERTLRAGDRVIDVGAGSGILSVVSARLGAREVIAVESDPYATAAARENAALNGVVDRIEIVETVATVGFLAQRAPFDGIVANIESGVLTPLLPGFRAGLSPGGWLVVSGILATERDDFLVDTKAEGLRVEDEDREDEWWSARFTIPDGPPPGS